jgi:hypothetical protein
VHHALRHYSTLQMKLRIRPEQNSSENADSEKKSVSIFAQIKNSTHTDVNYI